MIVFDKDLATNKHLWVFNNNIIKFHDDENEESVYAIIATTDFTTDPIYPDPSGKFTFNFKDYLKAHAVKNKLADTIASGIDIDNTIASLLYDDTSNLYFPLEVEIVITRVDADNLTRTKNYEFISGVEQLEDYQRQEQHQKELFALSRLDPRNNLQYSFNYWKGYPFDITLFTSTHGNLKVKNLSNLLDIDLTIAEDHKINRLVFSDGDNDITIEDYLALANGVNRLQITRPGYDSENDTDLPILLKVNKRASDCGYYIKYRTESGGWAYWLFDKNSEKTRRGSNLESLNNDHNNIEDTIAPVIQTGKKSSYDTIRAYAIKLNEIDLWNLEYIIDSPKIYLFTGEPYSINQTAVDNQWIEISCITNALDIKRPKKKRFSFSLDFKLPQRNKVTLL